MRSAVSRASVAMGLILIIYCDCIEANPQAMHAVSKGPRPRGARHARRTSLRWTRSKRHAKRPTCTLLADQDMETTWPALCLLASVCALRWGRSPWGRASLRLREPCHFETQCMMGFSALPPYVDNHLLSLCSK